MMKHSISSRSSPTQYFPTPKGKGLLHFLVLDRVPIPQVLEHKEYGPQDPHFPSTAIKYVLKFIENSALINNHISFNLMEYYLD